MNHAHSTTETKAETKAVTKKAAKAATNETEGAAIALHDQVEHVRDLVVEVRDKALEAFKEKPYLVPITAGAVGFGVGVLFGSKLTRLVVMTVAGGLLTEVLGGEIKRLASEYLTPEAGDDGAKSSSDA